MTSKDITITYGNEVGDCTRPYHVTLNRSDITIKEFIDYVLSERKSEWGYIRIYNWGIKTPWDADYEFEYRHGVAKADEVIPPYVLASYIKTLSGSGGWSRSDWDIIIEGKEQMTYEENVRAILESNFAGFKEEVIDTACKMILGLRTYGEWIPCSERLPEENICDDGYVEPSDYVLVFGDHGNYGVSRYWGNRRTKKENPCSFPDWLDLNWNVQKPIAWMPLPEPYKQEDEHGS